MEHMNSNFTERLKELLAEKNMSASKLSKELGLSINTVKTWEKGNHKPNVDAIIALAQYFGVTISYMCGAEK